MSIKIINVNITKNIIAYITDYIINTQRKFAIISGGKRPLTFINKKIIQTTHNFFLNHTFFTNESFINYILCSQTKFIRLSDFEAVLILFKIIQNTKLNIIDLNTPFITLIEWIREILLFIDQLDLEDIYNSKLKFIESNASIGYDVPKTINNLLKNISYIRQIFHNELDTIYKLTRGYTFFKISKEIDFKFLISKFDEIIMMAPFYLYKSEINILKKIANNNNVTIFIHGDPNKYKILKELYHSFKKPLPVEKVLKHETNNKHKLDIYSASDNQTQSALIKNIISNYSNEELDNTAIIVLDHTIIQPIIAEISVITNRYNLTTGYKIEQTSIFILINSILEAQINRRNEYYYLQNIIDVLNNSIVRNTKFTFHNIPILQIIIYNIEEYLLNNLNSVTFISFKDIICNKNLINKIVKTVTNYYLTQISIIKLIKKISNILFMSWENINDFKILTNKLSCFLYNIRDFTNIKEGSLDFEAINIFLKISENLQNIKILEKQFTNKDILLIFQNFIKGFKISLKGTPFKGIQILGLLETRNLSFNNVFIVGMIDSVLPYIKKDYPLIPIEIMNALGLKRIEQQLEIQKYHFYRLINNSKNIHLIYPDTEMYDRSRFIESIIWSKQLKNKDINNTYVKKFVSSKLLSNKIERKKKYLKTKNILSYLKNMSYTYSKINVYLQCRLKFYFMYVLLLDNKYNINYDDKAEDVIGNFIHNFLKDVFCCGVNRSMLKTKEFHELYKIKFIKYFDNYAYFKFRSDKFIIKEIIRDKMLKLLNYDVQREYKCIYSSETQYNTTIQTNLGNIYKLNCKIDRVDKIDKNNYTILDYKTGSVNNSIVKKKNFFNYVNKINLYYIKECINSLQLPLYKYIFEKHTGLHIYACSIYDIKRIRTISFPNIDKIYEKCLYMIKFILDEINTMEYFELNSQDTLLKCNQCEYFYVCR
jgi:hypothetical protein